jgi:hypothetical protein
MGKLAKAHAIQSKGPILAVSNDCLNRGFSLLSYGFARGLVTKADSDEFDSQLLGTQATLTCLGRQISLDCFIQLKMNHDGYPLLPE